MWTDEQLLEQGWTREQIDLHRSDQATKIDAEAITNVSDNLEDVQQLVPEVIGTNSDGMLSLDYPKLTATLIKALQEAMERIEELEQSQVYPLSH